MEAAAEDKMTLTRIALAVGLSALAGCGTGSMILWNPLDGALR